MQVVLASSPDDERVAGYRKGAELAAEQVSQAHSEAFRVKIVQSKLEAQALLSASNVTTTIGALAVGGAEVLRTVRHQLDANSFPVFELADDLYDAGALGASMFQVDTPHSWEAWRLARYFGPGDRRYKSVGLMREPGLAGDSAFHSLGAMFRDRGLTLVDAQGDVDAAFAVLSAAKPQAVVIEGSRAFIAAAIKRFGTDNAYAGRSKISDGWRPQLAGFHSSFAVTPVAGMVIAGDYARPAQVGDRVEPVAAFRAAFRKRFHASPTADEVDAYDATMVLADSFAKAGLRTDRSLLIAQFEQVDRSRYGHLRFSFGLSDHVMAERDLQGLWSPSGAQLDLLMKTFTADLQRTNILDEDWMYFFSGSTPGGEAPFYNTARSGILSDASDDLH
ncbi:MAG: ABC transporter substrate-binding protein [Actinomycetota bacterium]|nr:hypothetical protein [Actinomycetota bacterium]